MIIERKSYNIPFKIPDRAVPSRRCTAISRIASELGMPDTYAASLLNEPEEICRFRNVVEKEYAVVSMAIKKQTGRIRKYPCFMSAIAFFLITFLFHMPDPSAG